LTYMLSIMYYHVERVENVGKREGKVGAGYTETPCGRFGISTGPNPIRFATRVWACASCSGLRPETP
jgi:hypothetical protein